MKTAWLWASLVAKAPATASPDGGYLSTSFRASYDQGSSHSSGTLAIGKRLVEHCDDKNCDCKRHYNAKDASIGYEIHIQMPMSTATALPIEQC